MALTLGECAAMIEAARRAGIHLIVGHSHSFDAPILRTRALIDGGAFGAVHGWIALQRHGVLDDFHDNNVNYQWCKQVTPGSTVTVQIRLARGDGNLGTGQVFLQQEHFYIDASQTFGGCVAGSTD